jgi:hypothetical protein
MEEENQQLLSKLESTLAEHILELKALREKCGELRNEAAQHFVEYANHRCLAGDEPKALGLQLIAGSDLMRLVAFNRMSLDGFYGQLAIAFDSESIRMIKDFDNERAEILILQEAVSELKKRIRAARQSSAETRAPTRSSALRRFLAAARAIIEGVN